MGRNTKAANFLKECMADALIRQMQIKDFSKVTINEIAEIAGVNRSTWFRNFDTKEEALTFKLVQLWNRYAEEHNLVARQDYRLNNAKDFFAFNYEIRDLLHIISDAGLSASIYQAFYELMMSQYGNTPAECYEARFYSYGIFGFLTEWIKRDFQETAEEMTALFNQIIHSGTSLYDIPVK